MSLADVALFPKARRAKAAEVARSFRSSGSYASDHHEIWRQVAGKLEEGCLDLFDHPSHAAQPLPLAPRSYDLDTLCREQEGKLEVDAVRQFVESA